MQSKPWYTSRTVVASVVAAIVSFLNLFHLNLSDLVPMITDTIGQVVNAGIALIVLYHAIKGRVEAVQPIHLTPPPTLPPNSPLTKVGLVAAAALLALTLGLTGCGVTNTASTTPSGGAATPTPTPTPSAMKVWVDNNWLIFYDAGYYGAEGYVTFGVQHASTKLALANDVTAASVVLAATQPGSTGLSAATISAQLSATKVNAGNLTSTYGQMGSILSPFLAPAIALLGNDTQAIVEALALIAKGMSDYAATIINGTPNVAPTSNPYASPSSTFILQKNQGREVGAIGLWHPPLAVTDSTVSGAAQPSIDIISL